MIYVKLGKIYLCKQCYQLFYFGKDSIGIPQVMGTSRSFRVMSGFVANAETGWIPMHHTVEC